MVCRCVVQGCVNKQGIVRVRTHIFPKDVKTFNKWKVAVRKEIVYEKRGNYVVCDIHFSDDSKIIADARSKTNLKRNAVPTLLLDCSEECRSPAASPTRNLSPTITYSNPAKRKSLEPLEVVVNKKPKVEDEFDAIGKHAAHKLRRFPKEIKIFAEKMINDLFIECETGNVNKYTRLNLHQIVP